MPKWLTTSSSCPAHLNRLFRSSSVSPFSRQCQRLPIHGRHGYATAVAAAELQFGQPVHETHPHLLEPGERQCVPISTSGILTKTISLPVTPGITALEYAQRRSRLAAKLPQNSIAILAASELKYRSGAVFYEYRQDSNFFYLTGKSTYKFSIGYGANARQASTNQKL